MTNTADLENKETPLHLAVKQNNVSMVKALLGLKVSVDEVDIKGNSVFHLAASSNENIIKLLSAIQSTCLNRPNNAGKTPLHLACEAGRAECVKELLKGKMFYLFNYVIYFFL